MLTRIRQLLELIRFSHTIFALPFALLAALMAWRRNAIDLPMETSWRWQELIGILLCMVAARSAAMAFNRLADRKIDALNPRTAARHLPAGVLSVGSVRLFAASCSVALIASTLLFLPNRLPLYLSVPTLLFLLGYSYTKRFTVLAHFWLGAALGLAPIMAWIAIRGQFVMERPADLLPVVFLGSAVMMWVAGFDIIYACQDVEFDRAQNLHSIPGRFGVKAALDAASACHFLMVVLLAAVPFVYPLFDSLWWIGVVAIAALLIYEHWIVKPNDLARVNTAFFNVNAVVSVGLLIVGALDLWL